MSECSAGNSTPIAPERLRAAYALFEAARALIDLDTSQDPYHKILRSFIEETDRQPAGRILEVGSRARSGNVNKGLFRNYQKYVGLDIIEGENVDVVGDIHRLSRYFDEEKFDFVFSIATFEHLAMPWKAVLEINKVMTTGGWLYIATHPSLAAARTSVGFLEVFGGGLPGPLERGDRFRNPRVLSGLAVLNRSFRS